MTTHMKDLDRLDAKYFKIVSTGVGGSCRKVNDERYQLVFDRYRELNKIQQELLSSGVNKNCGAVISRIITERTSLVEKMERYSDESQDLTWIVPIKNGKGGSK